MHKKMFPSIKDSTVFLLVCIILEVLISLPFFVQDTTAVQPAVQIFPVTASEPFPEAYVLTENSTMNSIDLSNVMEYFFDKTGVMDFTEVTKAAIFTPARGRTHWGVRDEVCWFRVGVKSQLDETVHLYASNLVDHVPFSVESGESVISDCHA